MARRKTIHFHFQPPRLALRWILPALIGLHGFVQIRLYYRHNPQTNIGEYSSNWADAWRMGRDRNPSNDKATFGNEIVAWSLNETHFEREQNPSNDKPRVGDQMIARSLNESESRVEQSPSNNEPRVGDQVIARSVKQIESEREQNPSNDKPTVEDKIIAWSLDESESFTSHCRAHLLGNKTWGRSMAPYVDKLGAKELITHLDQSILNVPTLAHYDTSNVSDFTLETMQSLPAPYIIKATHTSGGVARVTNGHYECFKKCIPAARRSGAIPLGPQAFEIARKQMKHDLELDFADRKGQTQYKFVPHRIILEEQLPREAAEFPWMWMVANGQPLYVLRHCREPEGKVVFRASTRFRVLPIDVNGTIPNCVQEMQKPKEWDAMHRVAKTIGSQIPGFVRVDLYPLNGSIYFSELTFTPQACKVVLPLVTETLIRKVLTKEIPPSKATAEFVENTINDRSWVLLTPATHQGQGYGTVGYPSPLDLCTELARMQSGKYRYQKIQSAFSEPLFKKCLLEAKKVVSLPIRCMVLKPGQGANIESMGTNNSDPGSTDPGSAARYCTELVLTKANVS